jgi:hypothetical protein
MNGHWAINGGGGLTTKLSGKGKLARLLRMQKA